MITINVITGRHEIHFTKGKLYDWDTLMVEAILPKVIEFLSVELNEEIQLEKSPQSPIQRHVKAWKEEYVKTPWDYDILAPLNQEIKQPVQEEANA